MAPEKLSFGRGGPWPQPSGGIGWGEPTNHVNVVNLLMCPPAPEAELQPRTSDRQHSLLWDEEPSWARALAGAGAQEWGWAGER